MADKEKEQIKILTKLIGETREQLAKIYELMEEANRVLEGKAGMARELKIFEAAFDTAWCLRYAAGGHGRYVWRYAQDRPNMKRLIKSLGLEEVCARAHRYLRNDDPFFAKQRHTFVIFISTINQHAAPGEEQPLEAEAPADCKHTPFCTTDAEHTRRRSADHRA